LLNRQHVSTSTTAKTVKWDEQATALVFSRPVAGGGFADALIIQPFAMDIWQCQIGWEWWAEDTGGKSRHVALAPVNQKAPSKPDDKAREIYSVPLYSKELGGRRDFIVKGKNATDALCDLFEELEKDAKTFEQNRTYLLPIIKTTTKETDFATAPVFNIVDWVERPPSCGVVMVSFL
jgi:hypothetical protein